MRSFPLKFGDQLKGADADCYCESNGSLDFKTIQRVSYGAKLSLHCDLPVGKVKLAMFLVQNSSMQVTKVTSHMQKQ